jgi:hypothetical protein
MSFFSIACFQRPVLSGVISGPGQIPPGETDGTGTISVRPSRCRVERRAVPRLPAYIPSRLDENGRTKITSAKSIAYTFATRRLQVPASFNYFPESALDFGKFREQRRAPRVDDDIPFRRELRAMQPEGFAETAFDAVPDDGSAQCPGCGKAQPRAAFPPDVASQTERCEQGAGNADAFVIDGSIVGGAQNPGRLRKSQRASATGGFSWLSQTGRLSRR